MFRMAWRVNRRTGRARPFRPRLGGCLLWFLIMIVIVLVLALFLGGFRKGKAAVPAPRPIPAGAPLAGQQAFFP
jgi:heme A synthase